MSHRNHGNHRNIDLWSMKSAEEGQVIAQPVPKALSVISVRSALPLATNGTQEFLCDKKRKLKKNLNDNISREHTFFSGSSLHKGRVLGASEETDYKMAN